MKVQRTATLRLFQIEVGIENILRKLWQPGDYKVKMDTHQSYFSGSQNNTKAKRNENNGDIIQSSPVQCLQQLKRDEMENSRSAELKKSK